MAIPTSDRVVAKIAIDQVVAAASDERHFPVHHRRYCRGRTCLVIYRVVTEIAVDQVAADGLAIVVVPWPP